MKDQSQGPGPITCGQDNVKTLKAHIITLVESNAKLNDEVKSLTQKLLPAHNAHINLILKFPNPLLLIVLTDPSFLYLTVAL